MIKLLVIIVFNEKIIIIISKKLGKEPNTNTNNKQEVNKMLKINLTLEEKLKKICNDKELFKKNFWYFRFSEALIECGQDLKDYADDTCWWGEKFFEFVLKSLKEANEYNKPLQKGILNCYFLFDNDDYDAVMYTYFDEEEWVEDVRQMALDKEIWQYEYIVDNEEDLKLE